MSRRGENIYKRKDGRWEGRYKKGRKVNGKLIYGYVYADNYKEVKRSLNKLITKYDIAANENFVDAFDYEEWIVVWLEQQQTMLKKSTHSTYTYKLQKYVYPVLGKLNIKEISKDNIQELIKILEDSKYESGTIHNIYHIVKKSFNDALDQKVVDENPCTSIRLPRKNKNQLRALSLAQQKKLEATLESIEFHKSLPVLLALNAGLRIGEIAALTWEDVDFTKRMVHVRHTYNRFPSQNSETARTMLVFDEPKTKHSMRVVPMTKKLYSFLKKWSCESESKFVCSNKNYPCEPRVIAYYFEGIKKDSGITDFHFHQLRHTFATRCIESHGDVASISKILGHSSIQTTLNIYCDSLTESRVKAIQNMENLINN